MLAIALSAAASLAAAISLWAAARPATINVGFLGSFCGATVSTSAMARDGALLAIAECNEAGGIRGSLIDLRIGDDGGSPARAAGLADTFARDDCWAIIGPTSDQVLPAVLHANAERAVVITPTVEPDTTTGGTLFCIGPSRSHTLEYAARYLYDKQRLRHPLVVVGGRADDFKHSLAVFGSWMNGPDSGVTGTLEATGSSAFAAMSQSPSFTSADCVVVLAPSAEAAVIIQHIRLSGCKLPVIAPQCLTADEVMLYGGRAVEGVTLFSTVDTEHASTAYDTFREKFIKLYGYPPTVAAARGFEAARIAVSAIGQVADRSELPGVLASRRSFDGLHGTIIFNESGDTIRELVAVQVHGGNVRVLE